MEATKHAGGRPTKYDPSFCEKVDEYLMENQDEWTEFHKTRGEKSDSYERVVKVKLPSREGFSDFLSVTRQTVDTWGKEYPEFFDALSKIDAEQLQRLTNEGLAGNYNPVIAKLLLSANHGKMEKSASESTIKFTDGAIIAAMEKALESGSGKSDSVSKA